MSIDKYEVVIGLEVHAQLSTQSKIRPSSQRSILIFLQVQTATEPTKLNF